jgi:hypothetical protein
MLVDMNNCYALRSAAAASGAVALTGFVFKELATSTNLLVKIS